MAKDITFGNVGFSRTECAKIPIDWLNEDKIKVQIGCYGSTSIGNVKSSGMMLNQAFGGHSKSINLCYADPEDPDDMNTDEMRQFKKQNFEDKFNDACFGVQGKCEVTYSYDEFASLPIEKQKLNTMLFAQVECTQSEEQLLSTNLKIGGVACIGIYMCILFSFTIKRMIKLDKIRDKKIELDLVTIDDYTV